VPEAPALHRRPLVNAATIERQISPERFSFGLVRHVEHDQAAEHLFAVVVEQRPAGNKDLLVAIQIVMMRLA
jgi:hypothetical protein